ncbi:ExbD/TolR family protein [Aureivirga sp. CE67]|uniref:ExbD/TolR family protein n=1 Tax=Aureivirga sp. CE67 TaxID=1788983 RepID=UPI0018CA2EF2|nr:biopolymer transporter ExbD [Aureivirga sp. CE67]
MARRENPEINAGSMADIAFLLLIFFLVTTTMDVDSGISRKLPEKQPDTDIKPPVLKEKNIFEVNINRNNDLLVEGDAMKIEDLRQAAIDFIDNGGGNGKKVDGKEGEPCDYCNGAKSPTSSDHPNKAVISIQSDRGTDYGMFVSVQNELGAAYTELRNRLGLKKYNRSYTDLVKDLSNNKGNEELKAKISFLKKAYPQVISEAEPTK